MNHRLTLSVLAQTLCCLLASSAAGGPALADPMRPLTRVAPPAAVQAAATPEKASNSSRAATDSQANRLIAIRQDSAGLRTALFGQRWLQAGDSLAEPESESKVVHIGLHHVELLRGDQSSTVYLLQPLRPSQPAQRPTAAGSAGASAASTGGVEMPPGQTPGPDSPHAPDHPISRTQGSGTP